MNARLIPFLTLCRREVARFLKVLVQTVVTPMVSSSLYLLVFGVSLGSRVDSQDGVDYLRFLIPGLMMMGLINNAFQNSSSSIVNAKFTGELEDLRIVPLSHHQIIWAMAIGSVVRGGLVALITYGVGLVFYEITRHEFLAIHSVLEFFYFMVIGGLVFGMLGLSTAFWAKTFDQLSAVSAFVLMPLSYLGGVFISIKSLPPFWQQISALNPLLYFINGLRHSMVGVSDVPILTAGLLSFVSLLIFYALALLSLRKGSFHRW